MSGPPHNVIQLKKIKQKRAEGKTPCDSGFHKWQTVKHATFDVKQGKLVTKARCKRCGKERARLT